MSNFTPGPWELGDENDACASVWTGSTLISLDRADPHTGVYVISREEMLANTDLVIAAPDLAASLKEYDDAFSNFDPNDKISRERMRLAVINARAALTKAGVK